MKQVSCEISSWYLESRQGQVVSLSMLHWYETGSAVRCQDGGGWQHLGWGKATCWDGHQSLEIFLEISEISQVGVSHGILSYWKNTWSYHVLSTYWFQNFRENHPAGDLDSKDWSWNAPWMIRTARVNQRSSMWGSEKMASTSNKSCFV